MRELWHATTKSSVPAILKSGLQPQVGPRSQKAGEVSPAVYLFATFEDAENGMANWFGDEFPENEELALLKVQLPDRLAAHMEESTTYEVISREHIPASCIEAYDEAMQSLIPKKWTGSKAARSVCRRLHRAARRGWEALRKIRLPSLVQMKFQLDTLRWQFFAYTKVGEKLTDWATDMKTKYPTSQFIQRIYLFCLPF